MRHCAMMGSCAFRGRAFTVCSMDSHKRVTEESTTKPRGLAVPRTDSHAMAPCALTSVSSPRWTARPYPNAKNAFMRCPSTRTDNALLNLEQKSTAAEYKEVSEEVFARDHHDKEQVKLESHHQRDENTTIPQGTAVLTITRHRRDG